MKTKILVLSVIFIIAGEMSLDATQSPAFNSSGTVAQQFVDFSFFRVHRQGKLGVTATWGLTSNEGVLGFEVQRTYQDPTDPYSFWESAGSISCNNSRSFKFTDDNILPGQISYRIVAVMIDGSTVTSEVADIMILSH